MEYEYIPHWFKPLKSKPHRYQFLGFDIEGSGSGEGFVCGAIVGDCINEFYTDRADMWRALLRRGAEDFILCAHNLQYDLPILEGEAFPSGQLIFTRFSMINASYGFHGRKVRFWDTTNIFPRHPLHAVGSLVDLAKLDLDPLLMEALARGTSWTSFVPSQQERIRRYVERDAEIVYRSVEMMQELVLELGGQMKPTIAGIAMDAFRRRYHRWAWRAIGPKTNKLIRPAYYGGRVENFAVGTVEGVNMYDVTSLYPAAQNSTVYPHPNKLKLDFPRKLAGPWLDWEGIAKVTIEVPDTFIPILPYRHNKRLFFPTGKMVGGWPIVEIRRAIQSGCDLKSVEWVLGSETTFNPFHQFIEGIFSLREFYLAEDMGAANLLKLILNSLYGRWGINPESGLYSLINIENEPDLSKFQGYETHDINGVLFAYGQIESRMYPAYCNVFMAAQIAAAGRVFLFDELERQGEDAVYCDTDSIITMGQINEGQGLGAWRLQMENGKADLVGPKEYALHNAYFGSVHHAKGIPPRLAEEYFKNGMVRFLRAVPIREAIVKGKRPSEWVETIRGTNQVVPKRYPLGVIDLPPGIWVQTMPYRVGDLERWAVVERVPVEIEPLYLERIYPSGLQPHQIALDRSG